MSRPILSVKGDSPQPVEFSLEHDGEDVNIKANGSIVAYFSPTDDGRIELKGAGLLRSERTLFVNNGDILTIS